MYNSYLHSSLNTLMSLELEYAYSYLKFYVVQMKLFIYLVYYILAGNY